MKQAQYERKIWLFLIPGILAIAGLSAQSPIVSYSTSYISSGAVTNYSANPASASGSFASCLGSSFAYAFSSGSSNQLKFTGFTANSKSFLLSTLAPANIVLRRVDNPVVTGYRSIEFLESVTGPTANCVSSLSISLKPPYNDVMETFLNNAVFNQGTDNIFSNKGNGDGNNNNIERVDVIFTSGISSSVPSDAGFAILERGNIYAHDPFRIAPILAVDASGNPSAYGTMLTCTGGNGTSNGNWGHPSTINGNIKLPVYVLRKDVADPRLKVSAAVNQEVGGVYYSLADLGIAAGQKIYGYSLLGADGISNPTSTQLLNIADTTVYPTSTTETVGGGLDLITVNALFISGANVLLSSPELSFSGALNNSVVSLQWQNLSVRTTEALTIERSSDKQHFTTLYQLPVFDGSRGYGNAVDKPGEGTWYYRLKVSNGLTGTVSFSPVLMFTNAASEAPQLYPSLLKAGTVFHIRALPDGAYLAACTAGNGTATSFPVYVRNHRAELSLPAGLMPGIYFVSLINQQHSVIIQHFKIVLQ